MAIPVLNAEATVLPVTQRGALSALRDSSIFKENAKARPLNYPFPWPKMAIALPVGRVANPAISITPFPATSSAGVPWMGTSSWPEIYSNAVHHARPVRLPPTLKRNNTASASLVPLALFSVQASV